MSEEEVRMFLNKDNEKKKEKKKKNFFYNLMIGIKQNFSANYGLEREKEKEK